MITVVGQNATEVGVHLARLSGGLVDPPSGPLGLVAVHPSAASHTQGGIDHRFVSALTLNPTSPLGHNHGELLRTATLFRGVSGKKQAGATRVSVKAAEQAIAGAVETMPQLKDGNDRATAHHILRHYVLPALGLNQEISCGVHLQPRRPELFHLTADSATPEAAAQHIWDFYRTHPERAARHHEAEQTLRALLLPSAGACPSCRMVGRSDAFAAPVCATCLHGVAVAHTTAPTPALAGTDLLWGRSATPVKQAPPQPSPYEDVVVAKEPAAVALKPVLEKLQSATSRDVGGVRLPAKDVPDANAFATLCAHAAKLEFLKKAHVYASDSAAQRTSVIAVTDSLGAGKSYATNYYTLADKFAVDLGDLRVARLVLTRLANGDRKAPSDTIDVTIRQWKVDKAPHEANELEVTVSHKTLTTTQPEMSASQIATELMKLVGTPATEPASVRLNTGVSGPGRLSLSTGNGTGVKTASVPFDPAAGVKVTAAAEPGARFAQWRGDCSGSDPVCELKAGQLDHDANVTAVFTPAVTVSAQPAHVGDRQVEVQFQAPAKEFQPTKWDWVGWFKVGADDKGYLTWDWTHKQANGKLRLKAPTKAASGEYELRYYTYDKKYTPVARVPFMLRPGTVQDLLPELSSAARPDTLLTKGVPTDADMAQRLKTRASGIVVRSQTTNMAGDDGVFQRIASAVTNLNFFPDDQATLTAVALPVAVDSVFAVARPLVPNDKAAGSPHVVTYYDVLETALEEGSEGKLFRFVAAARPDSLINAGLTVSLKFSGGKIDLFVEKRQEHGVLLKKFLSEAEHEETVERNVASLLHHLTVAGHNAAH